MSTRSNLTTFDSLLRGLFSRTPEEMPDWARKAWAERRELERTGKRVRVEPHLDNTGAPCREVGPASLVYDLAHHDCCYTCNAQADRIQHEERVETGALPRCLEGGDWRNYTGGPAHRREPDWAGWCRAWWDVAYVRLHGFERDADALEAADGWRGK